MLRYEEVESRTLDLVAEQLGIHRHELHPRLRLIRDLNCDSLDLVELIMEIEDAFTIDFPNDNTTDPFAQRFFTRDATLGELAEFAYTHQGRGKPSAPRASRFWHTPREPKLTVPPVPGERFTQLGGRYDGDAAAPAYEVFGKGATGHLLRRRVRDGCLAVEVPATATRDAFLFDVEPVTTTAYARFLNSVGSVNALALREWFVLDDADARRPHEMLVCDGDHWSPKAGTETWPMVLVSWHGARAYARWAHGESPFDRDGDVTFLPAESQWDVAAAHYGPVGEPAAGAWCARHARGATYAEARDLPIAAVNIPLAVSRFGARHVAGNVWHWCDGPYAGDASIRAERGGSWVGPAFLCRPGYRRGRAALARGRCLGFRCVAPTR